MGGNWDFLSAEGDGMGAKEEQGQRAALFPYSSGQFLELEAEILLFLHISPQRVGKRLENKLLQSLVPLRSSSGDPGQGWAVPVLSNSRSLSWPKGSLVGLHKTRAGDVFCN